MDQIFFLDFSNFGGLTIIIFLGIAVIYAGLVSRASGSPTAGILSAAVLFAIASTLKAFLPYAFEVPVCAGVYILGYILKFFWIRFTPIPSTDGSGTHRSTTWRLTIPILNWITLALSLCLIIGVDVPIVIGSPQYEPLLYIMFAIFAAFLIFYALEMHVFSKRLRSAAMTGDWFFALFILLRNFFFLVNFVPLIHLAALAVMPVAGPVIVLLYAVMLRARLAGVPAPLNKPAAMV